MFKKISVVGAGSWGTALAVLLAEQRSRVQIWSHNPEVAAELKEHRTNQTYLPGVRIPPNVYATTRLEETFDSDLVVFVTPSKALREVAGRMGGLSEQAVIVSCTKGIEHGSGKLMSQILEECLPGRRVGVLSGPNHAVEVAQRIPAAGVVGCAHEELLVPLQSVFSVPTFRAYASDDVVGIQLGGALKNIFAIGAGVSDGFSMGDNAKAALVTRALAEMMRIGCSLGGRKETFFGLSGVGDLMVTCFSKHSRNRSFGERIGRGESPEEIQASMKMVAEGVPTARGAHEAARRCGIDAPITAEVHAVLYEGKAPHDAMWELLGRPPRREHDAPAR